MTRIEHFLKLKTHPWLRKIYFRLTKVEHELCLHMLRRTAQLGKNEFAHLVERWYLDKGAKPVHLNEMIELLICANSALPERGIEGAILAALTAAPYLTFEGLRRHLAWHHEIRIGRSAMRAALRPMVTRGQINFVMRNYVHHYSLTKENPMGLRKEPRFKGKIAEPGKMTAKQLQAFVDYANEYMDWACDADGRTNAYDRMAKMASPYFDELYRRKAATQLPDENNVLAAPAKPKESKMKLGSTIEAKREAEGLTREQVAKKIGITKQYYTRMEGNHPANCGDKLLVKICKLLKIELTEEITAAQKAHNAYCAKVSKKYRDAAKAKKEKSIKARTTKRAAAEAASVTA